MFGASDVMGQRQEPSLEAPIDELFGGSQLVAGVCRRATVFVSLVPLSPGNFADEMVVVALQCDFIDGVKRMLAANPSTKIVDTAPIGLKAVGSDNADGNLALKLFEPSLDLSSDCSVRR